MEVATSISVTFNTLSTDEYFLKMADSRNNITTVRKSFSEFIQLAKAVNKDIPQAKIEFPARGTKAFFQKLNKKFQQNRTGALDKMMKSIVQSEIISSHPEVKKFLHDIGRVVPSTVLQSSTLNRLPSATSALSLSTSSTAGGLDISLGPTERQLTPSDFTYLMQIGKGSFGRVYLATMTGKNDNKYYAIKTLEKKKILQKNETTHINCERKVLIDNLKHPFLVSLKYSFQTVDKLYFVLDYVNGGELFFHLQRDRTFPESRARFYSAEIGSAIGYMHERELIYRDLKPENILLGSDGHVRLTDFGLCKEKMKAKTTTETFCGTPEYLAPEVLQKLPYTRSIDWWCLGAVTYEMVYGLPPFYSRNTDEMYQGILYKPLKLNASVSVDMRDFLTLMLQKNPKQRLGHSEDDWEQVRAHRFFREINFDLLLGKRIRPAFIPNVSGPTDGRYIEAAFRNSPIPPSVDQVGTGIIGSDNPFEGFTFHQSCPLSYSLRDHRNANLDNFTDFH